MSSGGVGQPACVAFTKMFDEHANIGLGEFADGANVQGLEPGACPRTHAIDPASGKRPDSRGEIRMGEDREPVRLVQIGSDLGEQLLGAMPIEQDRRVARRTLSLIRCAKLTVSPATCVKSM